MSFEPRRRIPGLEPEAERAIVEVQTAIARECKRIEKSAERPRRRVTELVEEGAIIAKPGEVVRVQPGDEDVTVVLPEPSPASDGEDIVISFEGDGTAAGKVQVVPANGTCILPGVQTLNAPGTYRFTSTGGGATPKPRSNVVPIDASSPRGGSWSGPPPVTAADLPEDGVDNTILDDMPGNSVKGNTGSTTGNPTDLVIPVNTVLGRKGGNVVAETVATDQVGDDQITNAKLGEMAANTVKVNATTGSANPTDLAVSTNTVVGRVAGNIVSAQLVNAQITDATISLPKLATQATDTLVANITTGTASPTAVSFTSLANNSLSWDSTNNRFDYIGSTSVLNITPSGAQGVVNISTLLCGGAVTVQPTSNFDIDGFTAMPTGFWFDVIYRDNSAFRGTLNENTGGLVTSIRNPGAAALAFTTQESVRLKYYNTRWRVVGVSTRPLSALFPGAPIYDVMASPFNAVADGTADDTAAINAAIAAANLVPGVIYLGDNHRITAGLSAITADGIIIRGRGRLQGGTVLRVDAAAAPTAVVTFDNCNYGGIEDVWIRGVGALYSSGSAVLFDGCLRGHVKRCFISQLYNGIDIFESALTDIELVNFDDLYGTFGVRASGNGNSCHTTYITRCFGQNDLPAAQVGSVTAWQAATAYVAGNVVTSNGVAYQATVGGTSGAAALSGLPGATVATAHTATITDGSVTWVLASPLITWYLQDSYSSTFRVDDCAAVGGGYGLQVLDTLGDTPQFTRVNNLECDHCALGGVRLDGGRQAEFQQLFVTSVTNGIGVEVTANQEGDWLFRSGFVFGTPFEGFVLSADQGELSDFTICATSTRTANTYDAVRVDANVSHWNIADCTIGFAHTQAAQSRYGISIASGCDNFVVVGNRLLGHDTGAILNTPGVSSTRVVRSNIPETTTGAVPDGDYGDITVTVGGTVWNIDPNVVGNPELRQSAGFSVIGRAGPTTGNVADITASVAATLLKLNNSGTSLVWGQAATASIEDDAVTDPKLRNSGALSVIGRSANSTGDPADISATAASGGVLRENGSVLGFGTIALAAFPSIAADTALANVTTGSAQPTAVALSSLVNAAVSLTYDSTNHRFTYSGSTSTINLTPSGAQGVVDISTLSCGGIVTLQPTADFDIDGFTAKTNGFWFVLNYRDTTTRVGTLNENTGGLVTSIRNPGNAAFTFTTQETVLMVYANTRWRTACPLRVSNGDKGDITVTSAGATWTIDNDVVSNAKLRDSVALSVIGRSANSTGDPADIAAANDAEVLRRSGTTLGFGTVATAGLANNAVSDAKLRQGTALTVIGRSANSTGDVADIAAGTDGHVLRRSGITLGFGTVATAGITDAAVTLAKMENRAQATFIGRQSGAGTGVPQELTAAQAATILAAQFSKIISVHYADLADASISITPPAAATWFEIECQGAGGGGGGADADSIKESCAGAGGGAGAWFRERRAIVSGNITGAIGAGGAGGDNTGGTGVAGGATNYSYDGSATSALGGSGGPGTSTGPSADAQFAFTLPGNGAGAPITSSEATEGGDGYPGMMFSVSANDNAACGGNGGSSYYGGGGRGGLANADGGSMNGQSGRAPGSGGGGGARTSTGAASTGATGGAGQDGSMKVTFWSGPVPTDVAIT